MKKYYISTPSLPLAENQQSVFNMGAPFNCLKTDDAWNEDTKTVGHNTTSLQSIKFGAIKPDDETEYYYVMALSDLNFSTTPMNEIKIQLESIPVESRTDLQNVCLSRMDGLTAEDLALSVAQYCDDVLTAPYFESVSV